MNSENSTTTPSYFYPISHENHYRLSMPKKGLRLVEFLKEPTSFDTPFEEAVKAMKILYDIYSHPLNICLSGGLDSECMAQAAMASGVPFTVTTFNYLPHFNSHDIKFARLFCEQFGINCNVINLDIIRFYETGEFLEYALKYRTNSPQFAAHLWCALRAEPTTLFAGTPPHLSHFDSQGGCLPTPHLNTPGDKEYGYDRLFKKENKSGVGHFFQFTPELYFSFLFKTVAGSDLEERKKSSYENHHHLKRAIYEQGGFKIYFYPERNDKFTGFEEVKRYFELRYKKPGIYEDIFRLPLHEIYPPETDTKTIIPRAVTKQFNFYQNEN